MYRRDWDARSTPYSFTTPRALRAGQDQIEPAAHFLEVRGISVVKLHRGRSGIANLGERLVYLRPVDFALAQRHPLGHLAFLELEVLDVELDDALAQRANPVLRISGDHHVADIEIGADPRALEIVDIPGHFERAEQKLVPDLFNADDHLQFLGHGNELANLCLRADPGIAIAGLWVHNGRNQQHRVGSPEMRIAQAGLHALHALRYHGGIG